MLPLPLADHLLWIVCAAFYAIDNLTLVEARQFLIGRGVSGPWIPMLPIAQFRIRGRHVVSTLLSPPWRSAIRARWLPPDPHGPRGSRSLRRTLRDIGGSTAWLGQLGTLSFLNLFVLGPGLTWLAGLGPAVILAVIAHLAIVLCFALMLAGRRCRWRLSWPGYVAEVFEYAVCPGYAANIARRFVLRHGGCEDDALAYGVALARLGSPTDRFRLRCFLDEAAADLALSAGERRYVDTQRQRLAAARDG